MVCPARLHFSQLIAAWLSLSSLACSSESEALALLVQLRTDLAPEVEFGNVLTERFDEPPRDVDRAAPEATRLETLLASAPVGSGVRVAQFVPIRAGRHFIRIRLQDFRGNTAAERVAMVQLSASRSLTLAVSRRCIGVTCPKRNENPAFSTCVGGRCARPECTADLPSACPAPECQSSATCSRVASCVEPQCIDGICLEVPVRDRCEASQWCHPDQGCLPLSGDAGVTPPDASSTMDAAVADAASDAAVDADSDAASDAAVDADSDAASDAAVDADSDAT